MSFKGVPKKCFGFTAKVLEGPIPGGGGGALVLLLPGKRVQRGTLCKSDRRPENFGDFTSKAQQKTVF